ALERRPASRRPPSQSCSRAYDLPAERISNRRGSDQAKARLVVHGHVGHRSQKIKLSKNNHFLLLRVMSAFDAVDGSSTGTEVPWMWVLLRPPRFGGAKHASGHDNWSRYRSVGFSNPR